MPHKVQNFNCRHCHRKRACRPRGLCWTCYYRPGVRDQYPVEASKFSRRGALEFQGNAPEDAQPLRDGPGTLGRLKALEQRAAQGLSLFGRGDVGWEANVGVDVEATKYANPEHRGAKK